MSGSPSKIIGTETILLGEQFLGVRDKIEDDPRFANMRQLCTFDAGATSLTFKTEHIHPKAKRKATPVMLLFSNPHPLSVQAGMFLSEPRSSLFWRRLFDCAALEAPESLDDAIDNWDDASPAVLAQHLLGGEYGGDVLLHFDCMEALPTNQYADLSRLFLGADGKELRKQQLLDPGLERLAQISEEASILHWIVFSAEAFRTIVGHRAAGKDAPRRIRSALDEHIVSGDTREFWRSLEDLHHVVNVGGREITVYLGLIARAKNWKAEGGRRYFTLMLDRIFRQILTGT